MEFRPARKVERLSDCLEDRPGEIAMAVKMRPSHAWTKRPRGALLQLDPDLNLKLCSVGGMVHRMVHQTMKHLSFLNLGLTTTLIKTGNRTRSGGQFDWGGPLQKSNGGVQRYT